MGAKAPTVVLSHWNTMVEGLQQSSAEFYSASERHLAEHRLADVKVERVNIYQGSIFSAKREYLQITREEYVYHLCAAPYGNGFFVSSWLGEYEHGFLAWLASLPYVGALVRLFRNFVKPLTYYRIDTAEMFQAVVHNSVMKALDAVMTERGLKPLSEAARTPVMRDLFDRF